MLPVHALISVWGASSGGIWGSSSSGSDYSSGSRENIVESSLWLKLPTQEQVIGPSQSFLCICLGSKCGCLI